MLMQPYVIELDHVWFSYQASPVLVDVTFALPRGEFLGIIGPNGGGKTTLLRLMVGLKPDRGTIRVLGQEPSVASSKVGYVPQDTDFNRGFPISVLDVALMGRLSRLRRGRGYSKEDREKVEQILERVGMLEYRERPIGKLSGGQRQRVFIARALATEPEILFLDEPTAGVDRDFRTDLYDILRELNQEVTIVVITHDIGVVSGMRSIACVNKHLFSTREVRSLRR
jgi:zinc transport system ATP-binding protein